MTIAYLLIIRIYMRSFGQCAISPMFAADEFTNPPPPLAFPQAKRGLGLSDTSRLIWSI